MLFFIFAKYLYNNKNHLTPKPFFSFARNKLVGNLDENNPDQVEAKYYDAWEKAGRPYREL